MSCVLRVNGDDFDVEAWIALSGLAPYDYWYPGQSNVIGEVYESAGLKIDVSSADFRDSAQQFEDAIGFLRVNGEALARVRDFPGVEFSTLDFGIAALDVFIQSEYLPPALLRMAGNCEMGIEISLYPVSDDVEDALESNA